MIDIRCCSCNKLFGKALKGAIQVMPSSDIPSDIDIASDYVEEVKCNGCGLFNSKILLNSSTSELNVIRIETNERHHKPKKIRKLKLKRNKNDEEINKAYEYMMKQNRYDHTLFR